MIYKCRGDKLWNVQYEEDDPNVYYDDDEEVGAPAWVDYFAVYANGPAGAAIEASKDMPQDRHCEILSIEQEPAFRVGLRTASCKRYTKYPDFVIGDDAWEYELDEDYEID